MTESSGARPAFYALSAGGWRDYVTLLHPPYTAWHLSYVAIGAALAPEWLPGRLGAALAAFFLAVGIGAHALDELNGRPLGTGIPRRVLIAMAAVSIGAAVGIGVARRDRICALAPRVRRRRRLHRLRLQPRAVRRPPAHRRLVRTRMGSVPGADRLLRGGGTARSGGDRRRRVRRSPELGSATALGVRSRMLRRQAASVSGTIELKDGHRESRSPARA